MDLYWCHRSINLNHRIYLNWLLAILSVIVVVAVYLLITNTNHNRRRLAREQFGAMNEECVAGG